MKINVTLAKDLYVPGSFTTIQAAVDAATSGDTIYVGHGIYNEAIYINKQIDLIGVRSELATITAQGLGDKNTVTFDGISASGTISGFVITGAKSNNWPNGNGIYCKNGASTVIINNTITENSYGIRCYLSSPVVSNNTTTGNGIALYWLESSSGIIINNTITENTDGIICFYSSPTITNNRINENNWHGINCDFSSPTITNNTLIKNKGCGISCNTSFSIITNNIISKNNWAGIYCFNSSSPIITNNTITKNDWDGIHCEESSPTIFNNIITNNAWGIYNRISYPGTPTINYNCVWGNGDGIIYNYVNCFHQGNDIMENPLFIGNDDFYIKPTSPCIDKGSNTAPGISQFDKDGNPRIVRTVDIGAYEFQGTPTAEPSQPATNLKSVYVYPNPCKEYKYITFTNLTMQAKIQVFNIAGEKVAEFENGGDEEYRWNISDKLASGVYIYLITNDRKQKAIGKIGIIK